MLPGMTFRAAALRALAALFFVSFIGASCGQAALGLMPGVINDPHNLSLRRAILAYGTGRICGEVQKHSMPLRLRNEDPIVGRFFPASCLVRELPGGELSLQFGGRGYVWTNLSLRLGFEASGGVAYDTDFLLDGSTMYVYFRPRAATAATTFVTRVVEQPQAAFFGNLPLGNGGQSITNSFGAQIMAGELAKGFTVIRAANGSVEFGMGVVALGQHPTAPFKNLDRGRPVLANERSEIHQNQRDFVGPLEVPSGSRLILRIGVDGAPAVDALLVPRAVGEAWLATYATQAATTPPPAAPVLDEPIAAGALWERTVPVPAGSYYLVLDNTPTAGRTSPTTYARDDRAALVSYAIELE
jgi:hypothetical protein